MPQSTVRSEERATFDNVNVGVILLDPFNK